MYFSDIIFVFRWWLMFFIIGIIFLPLTTVIFKNFLDKGYIFARILGVGLISYAVFVLGILKVAPFTELTIILTIAGFLILNIFLISKSPNILIFFKRSWKVFIFEELLFISSLLFWSYIRGHQPDIHGLEKYMDFGFINSILRSNYFPPPDMWFTPYSINYYYFGHLVTAVLTKLSIIPSAITFNLMLSTLFAFTFTGAFSIGANLLNQLKAQSSKPLFGGLLTAFLVSLAGNFHTIYTFFKPYVNENPVPFWQLAFSPNSFPNSYWYPNATRFIHNTIHEFPIYSSVVSDLHGHYLDVPFVLLTLAVLLTIFLKIENLKLKIPLISFLLAVMYMTNAWDGLIYLLLTAIVIFLVQLKSATSSYNTYYILLILVSFFIFSLPFNLFFKPFASGIGILCAPEFLTNIGKFGPFLFEKDHCQHSSWWQLLILYGFFYFWAISFIVFLFKKKNSDSGQARMTSFWGAKRLQNLFRNLHTPDLFILLLILFSILLIIIPEFIYVKDIYPGHYRANTMFKLVYQAFIMLSIASGYIVIRVVLSIERKILNTCYILLATFLIMLVFVYPYFAINSYYNLKTYQGLDGIKYLKPLYPTDYEGILWLNKNIKGQPVILEAQGDSYTDYGRVSANTGLPTVLGWAVHEWLWRGTYDIPSPRIAEVQRMYELTDIEETKQLLKKYNVSLVFLGELERQKYPKLDEKKFKKLGKLLFQNRDTRIYKLN